jgi:hypothetical protein
MDVATDDTAEKSPKRLIGANILEMKKLAGHEVGAVSPTCSESLHVTAARTVDVTEESNGVMVGRASKS